MRQLPHYQPEVLTNEGSVLASISELAEQAGLSVATVALYETLGLIEPIMVGATRRYGVDARLRLEIIRKGKQLGFSLPELQRLVAAGETLSSGS